jgi:hypothetical protein
MKITIPHITASGKRESWWLIVGSITDNPSDRGMQGFDGQKLLPGEHDFPLFSTLLEVRPVGTARNNQRAAFVYSVRSDGLAEVGSEFAWEQEGSYRLLRRCVEGSLYVADAYWAADKRMEKILDAWVGQPNNPVNRGDLSQELAQAVQEMLPQADDITVEPSKEDPRALIVTLVIEAPKSADPGPDPSLMSCVVPCYNSMGEEDLVHICVRVPEGYETTEDAPHYEAARIGARDLLGYAVQDGCPVFDTTTEVGIRLLDIARCANVSVVDLNGEEEPS